MFFQSHMLRATESLESRCCEAMRVAKRTTPKNPTGFASVCGRLISCTVVSSFFTLQEVIVCCLVRTCKTSRVERAV